MNNIGWMTRNWTTGDLNALVKNLGGEKIARQIQKGKVTVTLKKAARTLFDKHGRRIPESLDAAVCDPNRNLRLEKAEIKDIDCRIRQLHTCLGEDTGITGQQLKTEAERLLAEIREDSQIANIAKGICLPVILPHFTTDDLGTVLEHYLKAVDKIYVKTFFSNRKFYNKEKGALTGNVRIVEESRYNQLVEKMKQGPVMGIHFLNPLQGFSINASREQMATLPQGFILSGLDTIIAMIMWIDVLARDENTPGLNLAAFSCQSAGHSLNFQSYESRLDFYRTSFLAEAFPVWSSGLFYCG